MSEANSVDIAKQALGCLRESRVGSLGALLHPEISMELPYAPKGYPTRIAGRGAVLEALQFIDSHFKYFRLVPHAVYECKRRQTVVLEGTSLGVPHASGPVYQNRYVFLLGFERGLIRTWKEYFNPYPVVCSRAAVGR